MSRRVALLLTLPVFLFGCKPATTTTDAPTKRVNTFSPADPRLLQLQGDLTEILNRQAATGATVVARVVDPETGRELFSQNADRPVIPASNMKLTVSAAALERFGPDYLFQTTLNHDGKNLWLVGAGDPALGDDLIEEKYKQPRFAFLDQFAASLKNANITQVDNLYFVDDFFDAQVIHPTWESDDLTFWYAAPVAGLNINGNCIDVSVAPAAPGEKPRVTVVPPTLAGIEVINSAVTASPTTTSPATTQITSPATTSPATTKASAPAPDIAREETAAVYTITGVVTKPESLPSKPVVDPGSFTAQAVRAGLATRGINITGVVERRSSEQLRQSSPKVVSIASSKMIDVLTRVNRQSQNMFTDACAKLLSPSGPRSWDNGAKGVASFFVQNGISTSGFVMADGSGLSRANRVTARLISDLLVVMNQGKHQKLFKETLAVGGEVGTIRSRFKNIPGRVHAKTGRIGGVRSLSGYVTTDAGKTLVFSIIYNDIPGSVAPYEVLQDEAVTKLSKW